LLIDGSISAQKNRSCWDLNFNPPAETYTGMAVVKENIITDSKICSAGKW